MKRTHYPSPGQRTRERAEHIREAKPFTVPRIWAGEPAFIIGGGPSFDPAIAPRLHGRIFAINWAFRVRPDADVVFWIDERFFKRASPFMSMHTGAFKICRKAPKSPHDLDIHVISRLQPHTRGKPRGLSRDPRKVGGICSGGSALNLAYLFGCNPIVLLGFDMRSSGGRFDWHDWHHMTGQESHYAIFAKEIEAMAPELAAEGVRVVNCSARSALTCFEKSRVEAFL